MFIPKEILPRVKKVSTLKRSRLFGLSLVLFSSLCFAQEKDTVDVIVVYDQEFYDYYTAKDSLMATLEINFKNANIAFENSEIHLHLALLHHPVSMIECISFRSMK
jgi:hypothetical protein